MNKTILTSLMKKKYGVTRSSALKITEKDTLYTIFRKLADYIYKNGDWTAEDRRAAVETMVRNRERIDVGIEDEQRTVIVTPCTNEELKELGRLVQSYTPYTARITRNLQDGRMREEIRYVLLDEQNKVGTKHNKYYWLQHPNAQQSYAVKKTYGYGNVNRAIGYDRIIRDLIATFQQQEEKLNEVGVTISDVQRFLHNVTSSEYSGKKWRYLFTKSYLGELTEEELASFARDENPRYWGIPPEIVGDENLPSFRWRDLTNDPTSRNKLNLDKAPYLIPSPYGLMHAIFPQTIQKKQQYNRVLQFIQTYLEDSYDMILQQEYEKSIDQMTRASAWQTKKQINQETKTLMEETTLHRYFGFIELDNDVDLELFYAFESEMEEVFDVLPQVAYKPDLRLRKLGNYHALGLYHCSSNTIAIDFRGPEDKNHCDYAPNQNGIQSFLHEYAHFLDYNVRDDGQLLSMQADFKKIVGRYRENMQQLALDSPIKKKSAYYGTPTEVFARAFELYSSKHHFQTSFIGNDEMYKEEDYQCFDKELIVELTHYFDQVFPGYKEKINEFQSSKDFVLEEESMEEMEMGM